MPELETCPICCNVMAEVQKNMDESVVNCPRCGEYIASRRFMADAPNLFTEEQRRILSMKVRRSKQDYEPNRWNVERARNVLESSVYPTISEQIDGLVEWMGKKSPHPGALVTLTSMDIEGWTGANNTESLFLFLKELEAEELISIGTLSGGEMMGRGTLTVKGLKHFDEITKGRLAANKAFMAMKFGDPVLNKIFSEHFKPAVSQTGYTLFRLDERPEAGLIDIRLRQEIKTSKFVVADLSHDNLGAYWEAGFAEGNGKAVIYTCEKEQFEKAKTHFDVNHHLTIMWDKEKPHQAADELKAAIRYTFPEANQEDSNP